jgi:hypothetical protein
VNELAPRRPNRLEEELAKAMRSTAESAKLASIDPCRAEANAYIEAMRAETPPEAGALRQTAEADVARIREDSQAQVDRIHAEAEQRITRRRELLDQELQERNSGIELEVKRVQERAIAFQNEVAEFFDLLLQGADPAAFAAMASQIPMPPDFELERDGLPQEPTKLDRELRAESPAGITAPRAPLEPGTISGAGAVRGRYYPEWYVEVERLREVGDENSAVALLLDVVDGMEAESHADDIAVASALYDELAVIYRGRGDAAAEISILERFARQKRAPGAESTSLLERLASLKGPARR